jgi:hypothetical protein
MREVLSDFPHSQHRPTLTTTGIRIPIINSIPRARWNFQKVNLDAYASEIERTCMRIPATQDKMQRFTKLLLKSARNHIPRGHRSHYIPCWIQESEELLTEYERTNNSDTADQLLSSLLDERRKRWIDTVESLDFTRSSRHAWRLLSKLDLENTPACRTVTPISTDAISEQFIQRSARQPDHAFETSVRKEYQRLYNSYPEDDNRLTSAITEGEMQSALQTVKMGKAAGTDGIFPEMIKQLGAKAKIWLASALTDVIRKAKYPDIWKKVKIIAILKPGKPADDPANYRPISLLSCIFKLLERIILSRIAPIVEPHIPADQAGFRPKRGTAEQTLALTCHIESGFESKMKTGAIFIDLSAAYDTVWRWGLMLKTARMVKCKRTLRLLLVMTGTRHFHICLGEQVSRTRTIKNGVPQGSVLAQTLFNIYLCDIPDTASQKFGYADDWAITSQSGSIKDLERTLTEDAASLHNYFEKWYLKMNTTKSVTTLFHLDNNSANQSLDVQIYGNPLPPDKHPKYLGVTLDRSLTYKQHIDKTTQKLNKRISLIRKLAGTNWGAHQSVLRTSSIALCYSVAEYCAPTWERSAHAKKIDVQLNKVMRIISGATQPTPTIWLPTMCNIEPPHLRRKNATQVAHSKSESLPQDAPLTIVLQRAPNTSRLKSRKPFYKSREVDFRLGEEWEHFWEENVPTRG